VNVADERTRSLWMDCEVAPRSPVLDGNESADTVIVGSGIAGLSTAYELAIRGQSLVVLDRGAIGMGMTARTTAHLAPVCDDTLDSLLSRRGLDAARGFQRSQEAAVDRIEAVVNDENIECGFRRLPGYLFAARPDDASILDRELEVAGKLDVRVAEHKGLPFKGKSRVRALRYDGQGAFHPLQYLHGLAAAIRRRNGRLYGDTAVLEVEEDKSGRVTVKTANGRTLKAAAAVVATNSPINDRYALHTKEAPYRTYAMAFRVPRGTLEDALYWDTLDPYHYVRLHPATSRTDTLIVGGEDHKTGEADDADKRYGSLERWIRRLVPDLGKETHRWSGQVMDTIDFSAFIGRNPGNRNVFVATGDSGQGITHGVVAGLLLADLITAGRSDWEEVYEPSRKPLRGAATFLSENVTAVKNFAEYIAPGEISSVDELEPGQGAILRQGIKKIAAYRDDDGKLTLRSAACTHLGCHLHWNSLERCWDCPCHGSHFATDGSVLNGPAIFPLAEIEPS
jgi:glycine/D-amino acid oxidase-like deaminating enzyme/nitrite reductase/ring-hydroxylating ferredoxin subunit